MIFINLSNHPSSEWSEEQIRAAKELGRIVDLPFPAVPEDAGRDAVQKMVVHYVRQVQSMSDSQGATVHVMGEMTFTYALVSALKSLGYYCVASTTRRIVEYDTDGTKKVQFAFCRFREY